MKCKAVKANHMNSHIHNYFNNNNYYAAAGVLKLVIPFVICLNRVFGAVSLAPVPSSESETESEREHNVREETRALQLHMHVSSHRMLRLIACPN